MLAGAGLAKCPRPGRWPGHATARVSWTRLGSIERELALCDGLDFACIGLFGWQPRGEMHVITLLPAKAEAEEIRRVTILWTSL